MKRKMQRWMRWNLGREGMWRLLDRLVSFKLFQGAQSRLKGDTWSCHYAYGSLLPHWAFFILYQMPRRSSTSWRATEMWAPPIPPKTFGIPGWAWLVRKSPQTAQLAQSQQWMGQPRSTWRPRCPCGAKMLEARSRQCLKRDPRMRMRWVVGHLLMEEDDHCWVAPGIPTTSNNPTEPTYDYPGLVNNGSWSMGDPPTKR